jgi:hypothetical protein
LISLSVVTRDLPLCSTAVLNVPSAPVNMTVKVLGPTVTVPLLFTDDLSIDYNFGFEYCIIVYSISSTPVGTAASLAGSDLSIDSSKGTITFFSVLASQIGNHTVTVTA